MRLFFLYLLVNPLFSIGQINDNFTDGDFSSNPLWIGDVSEYNVNISSQLQLNYTVAGSSYLSTSNLLSSLNGIEWQFYIKQSFSPSSNNYGRVYLVSDQQNIEGSLNGYYLQFGEAGNNDAVELFRQTGSTSTSIARGTAAQIANSFSIKIKVTRDNTGLWSLYVDAMGGNNFLLEASGTDNTYNNSSYFGIVCVYTTSNATKFYFDDFFVGPIFVDSLPPVVSSLNTISSNQLDVYFDEAIELTSAQNTVNYYINNGIGNPSSVIRDTSDFSLVHLTFAIPFADTVQNTLTINRVKDLNNNSIANNISHFTYYAPVIPEFKEVIINEIYADPSPTIGLPAAEYIELYNKSSKKFNLNEWKFSDGISTGSIGSYTLTPDGYLILCSSSDVSLFTSYGNVLGISNFPSLNNSGDHLYLKDNGNTIIDSVNYNDTWYLDEDKKIGGWSLELIHPYIVSNCPVSYNWKASDDSSGGTPGTQNNVYSLIRDTVGPSWVSITVIDKLHIQLCFSEPIDSALLKDTANYFINGVRAFLSVPDNALTCVDITLSHNLISRQTYTISIVNIIDCSGNAVFPLEKTFTYYVPEQFDIVINEIMADPDPSVGLPDQEFIELYNTTPFNINLNGWILTVGTISKTLPDVSILPDSFLVLTSSSAVNEFGNSISTAGLSSFPALTNSGQTISLKNSSETIISSVSYSDAWYQDENKKEGGWSLEQIDADNPCGTINNWKASTAIAGGTPGTKNAVSTINPDNLSPQLIRVSIIDSVTLRLYFSESLDSTTLLNTSIYSIDNEIGNPVLVLPFDPGYSSVVLKLNNQLKQDIYYTITLNNSIADCKGNHLVVSSLLFSIPQAAEPFDVVLNEILFNPKYDGVDFVEIHNRSPKVIDLQTLTISSFDTISQTLTSVYSISEEGYLLFPKQYLVLTTDSSIVKSQYKTSPNAFLQMQTLPLMNVSSGIVVISNGTTIIDKLAYNEEMHFALLNDTKGVSLERIDYNRPTQEITNWHSASEAVGYATPTYQNSQYLVTVKGDEIKVAPEIFSPDNDGYNDVVNMSYSFDSPGFVANVNIYNSKGRPVKMLLKNELLGTEGVVSWDGITEDREKAPVGIYIIYFEVFNLQGEVRHFKNTCVLASKL